MDWDHLEMIGLLPPKLQVGTTSVEKIQHLPAHDSISCQGSTRVPVFLLAGQSNMVGRGKPVDLPADVVRAAASSFVCYDHDRNFAEKLNQPQLAVKSWTPLTPEAQYSHGGNCFHFGPEFGLANHLGYSGHIVKFAMGSTTLHTDWRPDGPYFRQLVAFLKAAIDSAPQPAELKAIFWLQGESDSTGNAQQVDAYEENLVGFFTQLRNEVGRVPVVISQVDFHSQSSSKRPKKIGRVNDAIARACTRDDMQPAQCSFLDGEMTTWDDGHLDSVALLQVGANMGSAYAALQARLAA